MKTTLYIQVLTVMSFFRSRLHCIDIYDYDCSIPVSKTDTYKILELEIPKCGLSFLHLQKLKSLSKSMNLFNS